MKSESPTNQRFDGEQIVLQPPGEAGRPPPGTPSGRAPLARAAIQSSRLRRQPVAGGHGQPATCVGVAFLTGGYGQPATFAGAVV